MELPPDLDTKVNRMYANEQLRTYREIMKCQHESHTWRPCFDKKSCECHCTAICDQHAREKIVDFLKTVPKPNVHANTADPTTSYAFTLTMPPGYVSPKPLSEVASNIMKLGLTNKPYERASEWAFVLEHTEQGTPHIHGMYKTPSGRRISCKYFERHHKLWDEKVKLGHGHKGGYHQKTRHDQSYEAYMQKEGVVISSPLIINGYPQESPPSPSSQG